MTLTKVVAITGCDSGLGWALAARSAREGLVTVAGMYQGIDTPAAAALKKLNAHPCLLDVTQQSSVETFRDFVRSILDNPDYELHAVVNNAGIMNVGDYECHTPKMIEDTMDVNLLGPMRVVSAMLPDLRKNALTAQSRPRIINVASHCGLQPLPGFATYSASKAGLISWTRCLRYELRSLGLAAVTVLPGGFIGSSHILNSQENCSKVMLDHLDQEQKQVYERKLIAITNYLKGAGQTTSYDSMKDTSITDMFMKAMLDRNPKFLYKVEPWRYKMYYSLMNMPLPETTHNWIVKKFVSLPE